MTNLGNSEYSGSIPNPGDDAVQQMNYVEDDVLDNVTVCCNKIAQAMWDSYQRVLEAREGDGSGSEVKDDNFTTFDKDNNFLII